jgi:hypothetical protein
MAKQKVQKDKQRSTKHIHKTKDRVTRTPLKLLHFNINIALSMCHLIYSV